VERAETVDARSEMQSGNIVQRGCKRKTLTLHRTQCNGSRQHRPHLKCQETSRFDPDIKLLFNIPRGCVLRTNGQSEQCWAKILLVIRSEL
jgi:hypothetical protein